MCAEVKLPIPAHSMNDIRTCLLPYLFVNETPWSQGCLQSCTRYLFLLRAPLLDSECVFWYTTAVAPLHTCTRDKLLQNIFSPQQIIPPLVKDWKR